SESKKEYWGDSGEEDDDENDSDDENDDDDGNDGDGDDDDNDNDDDNQEDDDTYDDDEETDNDRTEYDKIKIPVLNQSSTKYYEEEEEKIDDEETMDEEEDDKVTKELHNDVNVNLGNRDADQVTATPDVTSVFTTTIPPSPPFFNPLSQQATPTPTPTTPEAITAVPTLPDFTFVFRFNDRVTNLERDLSELKQVYQYAQAISLIPTIMD
ncbi:hypothetical protein Tco_1119563, partial [Tanacetum coccineum]